jgi:AcrR family transcriptional regulator
MTAARAKLARVYRGTDESARKEERRQRFVEAAIRTFGTAGYAKTRIKDVCFSAKTSERYFYESFADKEQLLIAAYEAAVIRLGEVDVRARARVPQVPLQQAVVEEFFRFVREAPQHAQVLFFEVVGVSATVDATYRQGIVNMARYLAGLFQYDENDHYFGLAAAGALTYMATAWILYRYASPIELLVEQALRFLRQGKSEASVKS